MAIISSALVLICQQTTRYVALHFFAYLAILAYPHDCTVFSSGLRVASTFTLMNTSVVSGQGFFDEEYKRRRSVIADLSKVHAM